MAGGFQLEAFDAAALPAGFAYAPDLLSAEHEQGLLGELRHLPFQAFQFRGFEGKRRVVSYGWRYDFSEQRLQPADPIPAFLEPVREMSAAFADLSPEDLEQVSIIEYAAGSAIGWHRDKAAFGDVVGVSLLSPCRLRFRRREGERWARASFVAHARSVYLLRGPARTDWEHSIPPVEHLRYSITMRTLRKDAS